MSEFVVFKDQEVRVHMDQFSSMYTMVTLWIKLKITFKFILYIPFGCNCEKVTDWAQLLLSSLFNLWILNMYKSKPARKQTNQKDAKRNIKSLK